jgi:STE24 endopeptidase
MLRHRLRLPVAVAATVAAAALATFALRPRTGLIEPAAVDPQAYFSPAELERAREFRGPQRALGLAGLLVSGGILAVLALRPPRRVRRALEAAGRRPLGGGAAAGAAISVVLVAATLPLDAVGHARAVAVGLSTQGWGAWLGDVGKATAVGAVFAGAGAGGVLALVRRFPRRAWIPGSVIAVALSAGFVFLSPLVLEPLFNRFTPLPRGELRTEVLELAERAGVEVGEVFRVDASRRTTGANAYVGGLGSTKRVVLYDTLLERFPPDQVRSVVAHELGHVEGRDLLRGLAWLAIVSPAALFLAQALAERVQGRGHGGEARLPATPAALPAIALSLALVSFAVGAAGNVLSREVEARADGFALRLTEEPEAFIGLERGLSVSNVSEPDPPEAWHLLLGTHPTTVERIGFGLAFGRER